MRYPHSHGFIAAGCMYSMMSLSWSLANLGHVCKSAAVVPVAASLPILTQYQWIFGHGSKVLAVTPGGNMGSEMPDRQSIWRRIGALARTVSEIVMFTQALVALIIALGLGSAILSFLQRQWATFALSISVILLIVVLWYGVRRASEPFRSRQFQAKLLLREVVYQYVDKTHMKHMKRFKVVALVSGLAHFTDRYCWTGMGTVKMAIVTPGQVLQGPRKAVAQMWDFYDVHFRPLKRGEVEEIAVEWDLHDESGLAQPLLASGIYEPTDLLILRVILPRDLAPQKVNLYMFRDFVETAPAEVHIGRYDHVTGEIEWPVKHPLLAAKYAVVWSW